MTATTVAPAPQLALPIKGYGSHAVQTNKATPPKVTPEIPAAEEQNAMSPEMERYILNLKDVRTPDQQERAELLKGPTIEIIVDDQVVDTVPFRLFLAVSAKFRELYVKHGKTVPRDIHFHDLDKDAVKLLIHWVKETSTKKKCFSLKKSQDGSISNDLALLQAADGIGMRQYVNNVSKYWYKVIVEPGRIPTAEDMGAVEKCCPEAADNKLFRAVAQRLAHCLVDETVNAEYYQTYVAHHSKLAAAVTEFRDALADKKKVRLQRQEQRATTTAEKKAVAAHAASETGECTNRKAHRAAAIEAMNGTGGVKVVTAEQAAFLIRR